MQTIVQRLRRTLSRFRTSERGNVMLTFALATIPMIGFVGAAVDYSRANSAKSAMQTAADSTALMLSRDAQNLTTAQLNSKATEIFKALLNNKEVASLVVTPTFTTPSTGSFKLNVAASGKVPTSFTKLIGQQNLSIDVSSQVVWGVKRLELALALDVTLSMNENNKINELKKAAKSLLATLNKAAVKDGDIKVAIAPFSVNINVGTNNVNASWVYWDDTAKADQDSWNATNGTCNVPGKTNAKSRSTCPAACSISSKTSKSTCEAAGICSISDKTSKSTCEAASICSISGKTSKSTCESAGVCSKSQYTSSSTCKNNGGTWTTGLWTAGVWTAGTWYDWTPAAHSTWNGCVTDRDQSYDVQNTAPTTSIQSTLFRAEQTGACPTPVVPLTSNWTTLNSAIDGLTPVGATNVTIGLVWAFHALTPSAPLNNASAPQPDLDKVIILLTDGDNTQNRWVSFNAKSNTEIDNRTKLACENVKAANIKLYTVRVIDGNASLLQACASKPDMYFNVQNATQLENVFSTIAQNLANLRIAK